ncbi:hypothetical protein [Arthrobacter sp. D1-17]
MNRPDSNPSDPSANQDDAVWLDLVARLEGKTSKSDAGTGTELEAGTADYARQADEQSPDPAGSSAAGTSGPSSADSSAGPEAPARRFTDFDPLGLAPGAAAPVEPSAVEREQAAARRRAAEATGEAVQTGPEGPRDYGVDDEEGAFVPEDPPVLSATDPLTMLAWLGAVGSPIALVLSAMFWRSAPLLAILGIVAVFVAGVVYLIMKLPQEKDENDDGARV